MAATRTKKFGDTTYTFFASYDYPLQAYHDAKYLRHMYPLKVKIYPNGLERDGGESGEKAVIWVAEDLREKTAKKVEEATKPHLRKRVKELFRL